MISATTLRRLLAVLILLAPLPAHAMQMFVESQTGKPLTHELESRDSIASIKEKIPAAEAIAPATTQALPPLYQGLLTTLMVLAATWIVAAGTRGGRSDDQH